MIILFFHFMITLKNDHQMFVLVNKPNVQEMYLIFFESQ